MRKDRSSVISYYFNNTQHFTILLSVYRFPILGAFLLALIPVMVYGCSPQYEQEVVQFPSQYARELRLCVSEQVCSSIESVDIFTFNDDRMQRLESYKRLEDNVPDMLDIGTQEGNKVFFICANSSRSRYDWAEINSVSSLENICIELENENRDNPVMSSWCRNDTNGVYCQAVLTPLVSEITLHSIRCDFSGKPYKDEKVRNVRAYLINVNARCPITASDSVCPLRIVNAGGFNAQDMGRFEHPDMLSAEIAGELGKEPVYPEASFLCYPNMSRQESPGTPYTRLVIEGNIREMTYYWAININRHDFCAGEEEGIGRNRKYIFDITLKRKGTDNPDIAISPEDIDMKLTVKAWSEKEEYTVRF